MTTNSNIQSIESQISQLEARQAEIAQQYRLTAGGREGRGARNRLDSEDQSLSASIQRLQQDRNREVMKEKIRQGIPTRSSTERSLAAGKPIFSSEQYRAQQLQKAQQNARKSRETQIESLQFRTYGRGELSKNREVRNAQLQINNQLESKKGLASLALQKTDLTAAQRRQTLRNYTPEQILAATGEVLTARQRKKELSAMQKSASGQKLLDNLSAVLGKDIVSAQDVYKFTKAGQLEKTAEAINRRDANLNAFLERINQRFLQGRAGRAQLIGYAPRGTKTVLKAANLLIRAGEETFIGTIASGGIGVKAIESIAFLDNARKESLKRNQGKAFFKELLRGPAADAAVSTVALFKLDSSGKAKFNKDAAINIVTAAAFALLDASGTTLEKVRSGKIPKSGSIKAKESSGILFVEKGTAAIVTKTGKVLKLTKGELKGLTKFKVEARIRQITSKLSERAKSAAFTRDLYKTPKGARLLIRKALEKEAIRADRFKQAIQKTHDSILKDVKKQLTKQGFKSSKEYIKFNRAVKKLQETAPTKSFTKIKDFLGQIEVKKGYESIIRKINKNITKRKAELTLKRSEAAFRGLENKRLDAQELLKQISKEKKTTKSIAERRGFKNVKEYAKFKSALKEFNKRPSRSTISDINAVLRTVDLKRKYGRIIESIRSKVERRFKKINDIRNISKEITDVKQFRELNRQIKISKPKDIEAKQRGFKNAKQLTKFQNAIDKLGEKPSTKNFLTAKQILNNIGLKRRYLKTIESIRKQVERGFKRSHDIKNIEAEIKTIKRLQTKKQLTKANRKEFFEALKNVNRLGKSKVVKEALRKGIKPSDAELIAKIVRRDLSRSREMRINSKNSPELNRQIQIFRERSKLSKDQLNNINDIQKEISAAYKEKQRIKQLLNKRNPESYERSKVLRQEIKANEQKQNALKRLLSRSRTSQSYEDAKALRKQFNDIYNAKAKKARVGLSKESIASIEIINKDLDLLFEKRRLLKKRSFNRSNGTYEAAKALRNLVAREAEYKKAILKRRTFSELKTLKKRIVEADRSYKRIAKETYSIIKKRKNSTARSSIKAIAKIRSSLEAGFKRSVKAAAANRYVARTSAKPGVRQTPRYKTSPKYRQLPETKQRPQTKQRPKQDQEIQIRRKITTKGRLSFKTDTPQKQVPKLKPEITTTEKPRFRTPNIPKIPPRLLLPRIKRKFKALAKSTGGYLVLIKEKGGKRFFKASKTSLPRNRAKNLGNYLTDNSAAATWKLVKSKNTYIPDSKLKSLRKFRRSKRNPRYDTYIEKNRYRIDTYGEKRGITAKGLLALRNRKFRRKYKR